MRFLNLIEVYNIINVDLKHRGEKYYISSVRIERMNVRINEGSD